MSKETIALLTILRDETQSRAVHARCVAEIERLETPKPAPVHIGLDMARPGIDRSVFYEWFVKGYADAAKANKRPVLPKRTTEELQRMFTVRVM